MVGYNLHQEDKLPSAKIIACPSCAASLRLTAYAQTLYLGCSSCGSIINDLLFQPKIVSNFKNKENQKPIIPIGTKGKLQGNIYEMIGFATYREYKTIYTWNEYILFNPIYGYATLSEFAGHWNYVVPTTNFPRIPSRRNFIFDDFEYDIFQRYKAQVDYAIGEFHWDILDKELPQITEFISPPNIFIKEEYKDQVNWYKGSYITESEIKESFNVKNPFPKKYGVGSTQTSAIAINFPIIKKTTFVFVLFLFMIQMFLSMFSKNEEVFSRGFSFSDSAVNAPVVTSPFKLSGSLLNSADLEFILISPVDNNWMELNITLVNDDTGEEYNFEQGVEYYYGYTGGEHWSEGGQSDTKILSSIPDGNYHLNIIPYRGDSYSFPGALVVQNYSIEVKRDVPIWSNLFWLLGLVGVVYFILYLPGYFLESRRWANSEFSFE